MTRAMGAAPAVEPEAVDVAAVETREAAPLVASGSPEEAVARDDAVWLAPVYGTVAD